MANSEVDGEIARLNPAIGIRKPQGNIYQNIQIGGNSRVQLGNTYFENLTINEICRVCQTNDAMVHGIAELNNSIALSINAELGHPPREKLLRDIAHRISREIGCQNTALADSLSPSDHSSGSKSSRLVSRTKLNFTLMPLGFSFEHTTSREEESQSSSKVKSHKKARKDKNVLLLRVPVWFVGYQYSIYLNRAASGWTRCLQVLTDVEKYSPYHKACLYGRLEEVQMILKANPGCVYERYGGLTGADLAAYHNLWNMVSFLATQGIRPAWNLDEFLLNARSQTSIDHWSNVVYDDFEIWGSAEKRAISQICAIYDIEHKEFWETLDDLVFTRDIEAKFQAARLLIKYPRWAQDEVIEVFLLTGHLQLTDPRCFTVNVHHIQSLLETFGPRFSPPALRCVKTWNDHMVNPLHWVFFIIGKTTGFTGFDKRKWIAFIEDCLAASLDIHLARSDEDTYAFTPLVAFYKGLLEDGSGAFPQRWDIGKNVREWADCRLQELANILSEAGVDLVLYGEIEARILKQNRHRDLGDLYFDFYNMMYMVYGPKPSDWHIELRHHEYDHVEEFWRTIEMPMAPGDLLLRMRECQHQYRKQTKMQGQKPPGAWVQAEIAKSYRFCYAVDNLSEMSPDNYHALVETVQSFRPEDIGDLHKEWWLNKTLIHCTFDILQCETCEIMRRHTKFFDTEDDLN